MPRKGKKTKRMTMRMPLYIVEYIDSFRKPEDYPDEDIPGRTEIFIAIVRGFWMTMHRTQAQIIEATAKSDKPLDVLDAMGKPMDKTKEPAPEPDATPPEKSHS